MKIRCTRPNASMNMNGIAFEPHPEGGMVSANEVPKDMASLFLSVDGFFAAKTEKETKTETVKTPPESSESTGNQEGSANTSEAAGQTEGAAGTEAAASASEAEKTEANQPATEAGKEAAKEGKPKGGRRTADKDKNKE